MDVLDAIKRNDIDFITQGLKEKVIRINDTVKDKRGKYVTTPLVRACESEKVDVIELLLEYNADPNRSTSSDGVTPLYAACLQGNTEIIELLVQHGAKINQPTKQNKSSPLFASIERNEMSTIQYLISKGADVNMLTKQGTPLIAAVQESNMQLARLLLKHGADVNGVSSTNETALHKSVEKQYISMIEMLHEHGASITIKHHGKFTLLHTALRHRKNESLKYLLMKTNGLEVNISADGKSPLAMAAETDNFEAMKLLLSYGAKVNRVPPKNKQNQNMNAMTALMCACARCHRRPIDLLLEKGAKVNEQDQNGNTALHMVLFSACTDNAKKLKTSELLMKAQANPMIQNHLGVSPFYYAVRKGMLSIIEVFLNFGADPNLKDELGETAIHRLVHHGAKYYDVLMKYRAQINEKDDSGQTVLHLAAMLNIPVDDIQCLFNHGAKVTQNQNGELPIHLATSYEVLEVFHRNNHNVNAKEANEGDTVLHRLVRNGINPTLLKRCVESGLFDLELTNNAGKSVVDIVYEKPRFEIVKIIEAYKKNVQQGLSKENTNRVKNRKLKIPKSLQKDGTVILKSKKTKVPLAKKKLRPTKETKQDENKEAKVANNANQIQRKSSQSSSNDVKNDLSPLQSTFSNTTRKTTNDIDPNDEEQDSTLVQSEKPVSLPLLKNGQKEIHQIRASNSLTATTTNSENFSIDMKGILSSEDEFFEEEEMRRKRFCSFYESPTSDEGEILYAQEEEEDEEDEEWTESENEKENEKQQQQQQQQQQRNIERILESNEKESTNAGGGNDQEEFFTLPDIVSHSRESTSKSIKSESDKNRNRAVHKTSTTSTAATTSDHFTLPNIHTPPATQHHIAAETTDAEIKKKPQTLPDVLPRDEVDTIPKQSTQEQNDDEATKPHSATFSKADNQNNRQYADNTVKKRSSKSRIPALVKTNSTGSKLPIRKTSEIRNGTESEKDSGYNQELINNNNNNMKEKESKSKISLVSKPKKQLVKPPSKTTEMTPNDTIVKRGRPDPLKNNKNSISSNNNNLKKSNNSKRIAPNPDVVVIYEQRSFMKATQIYDFLNRKGRVNTVLYPDERNKEPDSNELQQLLHKSKLSVLCLTDSFLNCDQGHLALMCIDKSHKKMSVVKLEGDVKYEKASLIDLLRTEEDEDINLIRPFEEEMSKLLKQVKVII